MIYFFGNKTIFANELEFFNCRWAMCYFFFNFWNLANLGKRIWDKRFSTTLSKFSFTFFRGNIGHEILKYRVIKKTCQLHLKSAIFHWMSWKYGFIIIRGREIQFWNQILDILIASASKSRSKNWKMVKSLFIRIMNFKYD